MTGIFHVELRTNVNHQRKVNMKSKCIALLFIVACLSGCVSNRLAAPTAFTYGKMVDIDPTVEAFEPGTILFIRDNGDITVAASADWLQNLGLSPATDISATMKEACDEKGCAIAESKTEYSGLEAKLTAEFAKVGGELSGLRATQVSAEYILKSTRRLSDKTDANVAFNRFSKTDAFPAFIKNIKDGLPSQPGTLVLVSVTQVASMGFFEVKFDQNIAAEAKGAIIKAIKLGGNTRYTFNKDKLRLEARPDQPLLLKWRLDRI